MRFLVSVDIEGASGVVSRKQTGEGLIDYERGRRWLTADCNAAIVGVLEVDPSATFVLHDTHGLDYRSVLMDELHPAAEVVHGQPIIFYETPDLESHARAKTAGSEGTVPPYDAALLIGMHARSGLPGVLSHVLDDDRLKGVWVNGEPAGESHVTIALAAHYGIPTVLITGDQLVCDEISRWMDGEVEAAVVKESYPGRVPGADVRLLGCGVAADALTPALVRGDTSGSLIGGRPQPTATQSATVGRLGPVVVLDPRVLAWLWDGVRSRPLRAHRDGSVPAAVAPFSALNPHAEARRFLGRASYKRRSAG